MTWNEEGALIAGILTAAAPWGRHRRTASSGPVFHHFLLTPRIVQPKGQRTVQGRATVKGGRLAVLINRRNGGLFDVELAEPALIERLGSWLAAHCKPKRAP